MNPGVGEEGRESGREGVHHMQLFLHYHVWYRTQRNSRILNWNLAFQDVLKAYMSK